ncbi:MAG: hypothetical protein PHD64_11505 [Mesotoga sp.]|nr:hypothetical protein [Mesotoga sp.]
MTTDPIQEARELLRDFPTAYMCRVGLLPALINEAERWQAIAIEEKASKMDGVCEYRTQHEWCDKEKKVCDGWPYMFPECPIQNTWRERAISELEAEAPSWKKIGPVEQAAIELIIAYSAHDADQDGVTEAKKVLWKLLEGTA